MTPRLRIDRLGAGGDGIAEVEGRPLYVPFTLPGELVTAAREKDRAALIAVLEASPLRVAPPCRHFGECGGCSLQHLDHAAYLEWKRALVVSALKARGIEADVETTVPCPPASRRRVTFTLRRTQAGMLLGYNRALTNTIIDIEECPIALPAIVEAKEALRALGTIVGAGEQPFRMGVTASLSGLDIAVRDSGTLSDARRRAAVDHALRAGFARLSVDAEIVVERSRPLVRFGRAEVTPPPGGFLQAVESAEAVLAELVLGHLGRMKRVGDLFSGCGTFTLRLAEHAEVHAVEGDAASLASLERGFRSTPGLRRVTTERRDLERRPLTPKDLATFDGICFDPPRAGAEAQARQLASSDVPRVAAVSCNPVTLARDLRILIDGGYRLRRVTPVDQFLWAPHVEAVALLEKPRRIVTRRRGL